MTYLGGKNLKKKKRFVSVILALKAWKQINMKIGRLAHIVFICSATKTVMDI